MNNEKEIEKMARIIKPFVTVLCEEDTIAEALFNAGIGDKKQAVEEFAEKLKRTKNTICIGGRIFIEVIAIKAIDTLITELYGADE